MEILTKSAGQTKKAGQRFAADLIDKSDEKDKAVVLALIGELGSGKTTFTQGLAKGLGIKNQIISPSYILMRKYKISSRGDFENFYHIDLYRLENDVWSEVKNLGIEDVWNGPGNFVVIEWADKIEEHLPDYTKTVNFQMTDENGRSIKIN